MSPEIKYYPQPTQDIFLEPAKLDRAFKSSIRQAKKSGIPTVIAQAKNNYGSWLMSDRQRRYGEAVPLFREVAAIQESQGNEIKAADAYQRLSSCLFLIGDVESLQEAEEAVRKAIELYPDSEDFTEPKGTAVVKRIAILASLTHQTGDTDYFNQGVKVYETYAEILNGEEVQKQLQSIGFTEAA